LRGPNEHDHLVGHSQRLVDDTLVRMVKRLKPADEKRRNRKYVC
jgi:hypothetical protein